MPEAETVIWAIISSGILLLLAIIGYLINDKLATINDSLKSIWAMLNHNAIENAQLRAEIEAIKSLCSERGRHCPERTR